MFEIKSGTKQEDPLSSLLFNTVLRGTLANIKKAWVYDLATMNLTASQTCVLLTTCSCSQVRWCSSKKSCATSRRVLRV